MNEIPETTWEEMKLASRHGSYARIKPAEARDVARCPQGEQLKQLYDSALQEWRKQSQPQVHPFVDGDGSAQRALQLREEALTKRNAAANRMYLHRASCAICRRRR